MSLEPATPTPSRRRPSIVAPVLGWSVSVMIGVLMGVMPIVMMVASPQKMADSARIYGYPDAVMNTLAYIQIACVALFLLPHTSMIGAILLTGYLGGAVATHVQGAVPQPGQSPVAEPYWFPVVIGAVIWIALLLREPRLRTLLPFRWSA